MQALCNNYFLFIHKLLIMKHNKFLDLIEPLKKKHKLTKDKHLIPILEIDIGMIGKYRRGEFDLSEAKFTEFKRKIEDWEKRPADLKALVFEPETISPQVAALQEKIKVLETENAWLKGLVERAVIKKDSN